MAAPLRLNEFIEVLTKIKEEHGDVLVGHYVSLHDGDFEFEYIEGISVEAYRKDEVRVVLDSV